MCSNHIFLAGVTQIQPRAAWKQLALPKRELKSLREFQHLVGEGSQTSNEETLHGTGPAILFCGPPGIGKSLAAEVLAKALKRSLFRVDLRLLMGKYIGETEKNLDALFRVAFSEEGILFFDEAEALFGKRAEVQDSHDRYANLETNYLLSRIEHCEVPCILTYNCTEEIDPSIARRFQMVANFPLLESRNRAR